VWCHVQCTYCRKTGYWFGVCHNHASEGNGNSSAWSKNPGGLRPSGRNKPCKTEYKKAKEWGDCYGKNNGNVSKGTQSNDTGKAKHINIVQVIEEPELPICASIVKPKNTPEVMVRVNGLLQQMMATPDTGACLSIINLRLKWNACLLYLTPSPSG
jgi:hypothetical protein